MLLRDLNTFNQTFQRTGCESTPRGICGYEAAEPFWRGQRLSLGMVRTAALTWRSDNGEDSSHLENENNKIALKILKVISSPAICCKESSVENIYSRFLAKIWEALSRVLRHV